VAASVSIGGMKAACFDLLATGHPRSIFSDDGFSNRA
jgi:hypothetical protein